MNQTNFLKIILLIKNRSIKIILDQHFFKIKLLVKNRYDD